MGRCKIVEGNLAEAKEKAVADAIRKGLEGYLVRRLGDQGMVNNFERLAEYVLPAAQEVIEHFVILAERTRNDQITLLVRVSFNNDLLDRRLREAGAVEVRGPALKVLVMVREKGPGGQGCWWQRPKDLAALTPAEISLYRVLQERGFDVLDRSRGFPGKGVDDAMTRCNGGLDVWKAWGAVFGADVVIYGIAGQEGEEVSLDLSALAVEQGRRVCGASELGVMDGKPYHEVLDEVVRQAAGRLSPCILREAGGAKEVRRILVTLKGVKNFRQVRLFRDFLKTDVPGVRSVRQRRVGRDFVTVEVTYEALGAAFAEQISNNLDDLPLKVDFSRGGDGEYVFLIRE